MAGHTPSAHSTYLMLDCMLWVGNTDRAKCAALPRRGFTLNPGSHALCVVVRGGAWGAENCRCRWRCS